MRDLTSLIKNKIKEPGSKKYLLNTSWLFIEKGIGFLLSFIVGVKLINYLGPELYGLYGITLINVGILLGITNLGLDEIIFKEIILKRFSVEKILMTSISLKLICFFLLLMPVLIHFFYLDDFQLKEKLFMIYFFSILFDSFKVISIKYRAEVSVHKFVLINIIVVLFSSLVKLYLIFNEFSIEFFFYLLLIESFLISLAYLLMLFVIDNGKFSNLNFDIGLAKKFLKKGFPLIISGLLISLYMRLDALIIKQLLGLKSLGIYLAGTKISEALYFIPAIISSSVFPAIISSKNNRTLFESRLRNLYTLNIWIFIFIAIPISFFSQNIIKILFGYDYELSSSILMISIWSGVFLSLSIASGKWYLAENYHNGLMYKAFFGLLINLIGNFLLIPILGINGAAISTLLGHFSASFLYDFFDNKLKSQIRIKINSFLPYYLLKK